ncbi:MAG: hypothetical protein PHU95_07730, partial [Candidatus Thermoplasmatota archaeon]|nr:hypothetical protein [Candidatus Thermoplasmatota archaeon]
GEVLSQTPAAGQKLEKGSVVEVDVSRGEATPDISAEDKEKAAINELLQQLARGRNDNDFALFMSCYSYGFRSTVQNNPTYRNLDYTAWQNVQAKWFSPPYTQRMTVDNLNIIMAGDMDSADVTFGSSYQLYEGGALSHSDYGVYTLKLVKEEVGWKILEESWVKTQ